MNDYIFAIAIERDPAETTSPCLTIRIWKREWYHWWKDWRPHFTTWKDKS